MEELCGTHNTRQEQTDLRLVDNVRCFRHVHLRHWSVGFINFPVLVVLVERRPMATRGRILVYVYSTTKANELRLRFATRRNRKG